MGASPQTPGSFRFGTNPGAFRTGLSTKWGAVDDTPLRSWSLGLRSGCFPAELYPPSRLAGLQPRRQKRRTRKANEVEVWLTSRHWFRKSRSSHCPRITEVTFEERSSISPGPGCREPSNRRKKGDVLICPARRSFNSGPLARPFFR